LLPVRGKADPAQRFSHARLNVDHATITAQILIDGCGGSSLWQKLGQVASVSYRSGVS
jgi:hypothetical protein